MSDCRCIPPREGRIWQCDHAAWERKPATIGGVALMTWRKVK